MRAVDVRHLAERLRRELPGEGERVLQIRDVRRAHVLVHPLRVETVIRPKEPHLDHRAHAPLGIAGDDRVEARRQPFPLARRPSLHEAEVEERDRAVGVEAVVARMRVAVEHAVAVHRALREPEEHLGGALLRRRVGAATRTRPTSRPSAHSVTSTRCVDSSVDDLGDANEGMTAVPAPERLLVRGLDAVVELVVHARPQLVDQRLDVEPLQRERGEEVVEHLGVVEIGSDRAIDAGVLHLDRDLATVGKDGSVHLTDGGCRHRDRVPVEEEAAGLVAELAADHPLRERRRHGRHVGLQRGERGLRFGRAGLRR